MSSLILKHVQKYLPENMFTIRQRHLYYQYNYNPIIEMLVNKHIQEEQQAAQQYLNMAVTFLHPCKCLVGAGGFFMKMYNEELQHMLQFIHYQLRRGGKPLICGLVPPIECTKLTLLDAMKQSLEMEKNITKLIEEFIKVTEELEDYHCTDYLTSVFLTEQMKSIHEIAEHVTKLTMISDYEDAIYQYDLKLAKIYPYSYKTKSL